MVEALSEKDNTIRSKAVSGGDEAVILSTLSPILPALPSIEGKTLRFASGEAVAPRVVSAEPRVRAQRRPRLDQFDRAVVVLIIVCAAICVYRLFWAMQP